MPRHKKLFLKAPTDKHILTDVELWASFLKARGDAEVGVAENLRSSTEKLSLADPPPEDSATVNTAKKDKGKSNASKGTAEERLFRSLRHYTGNLTTRAEASDGDAKLYLDLAEFINGTADDEALKAEFEEAKKLVNKLKKSLEKSQRKTRSKQNKYLLTMVEQEHREIDQLFNPGEQLDKSLAYLKDRAKRLEEDFKQSVTKDKAIFRELIRAANAFEAVWKKHELHKSKAILHVLSRISVEAHSDSQCFKDILHLKEGDIKQLIEKRVVREEMTLPRFDIFKKTFTDSDNERYKETVNATPHKKFVVVDVHKKGRANQIDLEEDTVIEQILPPNRDGMAYGRFKKGIFRKEQRGFYPVSKVKPLIIDG